MKILLEQSLLWEERAIEIKDFIYKYAWCPKNGSFTDFIKFRDCNGKEEEFYENLRK